MSTVAGLSLAAAAFIAAFTYGPDASRLLRAIMRALRAKGGG
jgi:hypothetical protein